MKNDQHIFGPVASRRLGRSLGIDLIPYKTCSLNCIYCECGATTELSLTRKLYVSTEKIIQEINAVLQDQPKLDYVTFSGSGEPTLASNIGDIIVYLKTHYPQYKIAVITNGNLLSDPDVQQSLLPVDVVIPSLDSATEEGFQKLNQPIQGLSCFKLIQGITAFKKIFQHAMWLEIFIVPGINDTQHELEALQFAVSKIQPTRIQLNSLDRPGILPNIPIPTEAELQNIAVRFAPIPVDISKHTTAETAICKPKDIETIIQILQKKPHTFDELIQTRLLHPNDIRQCLKLLKSQKSIQEKSIGDKQFYVLCD